MKLIKASYRILSDIKPLEILKSIENAGRVCYKSEDKITEDSCISFCQMLLKRGHEAMIEHGGTISVCFTVDRGVTHEMVRHRLFSFAQESTRYCNYSKAKFDGHISYIIPNWLNIEEGIYTWNDAEALYAIAPPEYVNCLLDSENRYNGLINDCGWRPEQARSILPNSLKSEIVISGNPREWRHFFKLRTASVAHPQMREVAIPLLEELKIKIPVIFDDIIY